MIIMVAPLLNEHLRFLQRVKHLSVQQLIPQATIKAFIVSILPGGSWLDVSCFDTQFMQPVFQRFGCKFTAIVRTDIIRQALDDKQITDDIQYIIRFQHIANTDR